MLEFVLSVLATMAISGSAQVSEPAKPDRPTVVLVHGAFADSSSWNGVIAELRADGYPVISAANPLRGVQNDGQYVANLINSIPGPVILVGHSYGGTVISVAAPGKPNVKALVFVAAFALDDGESVAGISTRFPEGTLAGALAPPVPLGGGVNDLYIDQGRFWKQFAADVPEVQASLMARTQRPITDSALSEGMKAPAWRSLPSFFIYGTEDRNIPRSALAFMAERAKSRHTVEIEGASHVVMVSHPNEVAQLIERAASESGCHPLKADEGRQCLPVPASGAPRTFRMGK